MASNKSTPQSVLDAPKAAEIYLHTNKGTPRRERRHGYTMSGKHFNIPADLQFPATNQPYHKEK